jgi:hypothetical protein
MTKRISLFFLVVFFYSCEQAPEESIKILSLVNGQTVQKEISTNHFKNSFIPLFQNMNDEVTKSLSLYEEKDDMPWVLNRVSVGLTAEAEVDLQIAELTGEAKFELRFQRR